MITHDALGFISYELRKNIWHVVILQVPCQETISSSNSYIKI